ncbi:MAG TPA: GGDEF domain-containing protein [Iamia sp.]|nr:GGDEF domain-containing protein [Iamia sp.]
MSDEPHPFMDESVVRRLVDDGMVLFLALDGDGQIAWVGDSCRSVLGRSPDELIGTSALDHLHPDDLGLVLETLAEDARNADDRILMVVRLRRASGSWATLEFGGLDLREADGTGLFLVWGRSYEAPGLLLQFLGSLLTEGALLPLLGEVVRWSDVLSPYGRTSIVVTDPGGRRVAVAADRLEPALGSPHAVGVELLPPDADGADGPVALELDALAPRVAGAARAAGLHGVWLVPVEGDDGDPPRGVVAVWRSRPGPPLASHARHYGEVAKMAQLALRWSTTRSDLQAAATTDPLTGVANRAQLTTHMRNDGSKLSALLFCDLDDFKAVNDRYGHLAGDRVLQAVASRMAGTARPQDLLVRLGGDEFAVWCPDLDAPEEAQEVAARLVEVLEQPVVVESEAITVGCSVGLALVDGEVRDGDDVDRILGQADRALYRAKDAGKHRWSADDRPR